MSRDLHSIYTGSYQWLVVARAMTMGLLAETDASPDLLKKLSPGIESYRSLKTPTNQTGDEKPPESNTEP